jgi:K+-sensing histidine kinase KdpD
MRIGSAVPLSRSGVAELTVGLALIAALTVPPLGECAATLFLAAVGVSAWHGGRWAGLLATALSGLALDFFFLPPAGSLGVGWVEGVRLGAFLLAAALLTALHAAPTWPAEAPGCAGTGRAPSSRSGLSD